MAIIDKEITTLEESWENVKGTQVEAFLKRFLQELSKKKIGDWLLTADESGLATLRAFASTEAKEEYEKDPDKNGALVLAQTSFYTSGAASVDYTLTARITENPTTDMVKGASNILKFTYNSYYGGDPSDKDTENGYARVWINNTEITELEMSLEPGGNEYSMELGPYLTQETNAVKLEIGNKHGKSRTFTFTIRALEIVLSLHESYEESLLREGSWNLRVACRGVTAQVHVSVDGKEIAQSTITNSTNDFTIDGDGSLLPGPHKIELYAENVEFGIRTETISTSFIKKGLSTPSVCISGMAAKAVTLYDTASIPYFLYYPNAGNQDVTVSFEVRDTSGMKLSDLTSQTVSLNSDGTSGMQELRFTASETNYLSLGQLDIVVKVGSSLATHRLQILDAGVTLEPATECKIFLSAAGRTNADEDAEDWHSEYNGSRTCTVKRSSNFKLNDTNGFINDAFLIKSGKKITLEGFLPFGEDFGVNSPNVASRTGRTFEFEFKAVNCTNSETKLIDCMSDGVGFAIYADRIELCSDAGGKVQTVCCDDQRFRVGFCIDGTTTHCVNQTVDSIEESEANIAYLFLNGVPVRLMDYKTSSWKQNNPVNITIGSNDCDIELYTVRIYDKSLNFQQMIGNFSFDTPDITEKIAIAKRNDVLDSSGAVDFAKVLKALPETAYKIWEIEKMPTGKKDWQKASTEFVNPAWEKNPELVPTALASFNCKDHDLALDGTSSLSYPDPYKNWADKYNGPWTIRIDGVDVIITGYSITNGVEMKAKEFVDKVNFASSEGIFNILAANAYQNILLGTAGQYPELLSDPQASQQAEGLPVTFRQSLSGFPIIGWLRENKNGSTTVRFLSIYNFINNKYDPYYFGYDNGGDNELWEVEDNVNFFSEELTEGMWKDGKWEDKATTLYYARVPKTSPTSGEDYGVAGNAQGASQANLESAHLRRFHNWIYSCNPHIAERYRLVNGSYRKLTSPVTFGDIQFTHDTPEYRKAKFANEYKLYLNKHRAIFYFVFFDFMLGVDSFDKNMTLGFEKKEDKNIASPKQRDSDTLAMYGNRGTLLFKIFHEWGDSFDESSGETGRVLGEKYDPQTGTFSVDCSVGSPVFNGRLSGLWDLVSEVWADDVKTMYQAMRSNGLNEQNLWTLFNSFWSQWCEALYCVDGMGYANTGRFDMAHGDKREVMRYFFKYRQRYLDSKCGSNTSKSLELRLWGTGAGVVLRHSIPLYASLNWGAGGIQTVRNIKPGTPAYFPSTGATFNETTFTVYDADLLTEISTYTELPDGTKVEGGLESLADSIDMTGLSNCTKLRKLILDYSNKAPNTNLSSRVTDIGNSIALEELVIRNAPNVTGAFNLKSEKVVKVDLRDTGATALTLPQTETLQSIELGASIRNVTYEDFPNLKTLTLQGYESVRTVNISGCPGIDTQELISGICATPNNVLAECRITDVNWRKFSLDHLMKLAAIKADLSGTITLADDVAPNFEQKAALIEAFGAIDEETNKLRITYPKVYLTSLEVTGESYIGKPGQYKMTAVPNSQRVNDFKEIEWAVSSNSYGVTIDKYSGILNVVRVGTEAEKPEVTVTCKVTTSSDSIMTAQAVVGLYERSAHELDLVYHDGTFSDKWNKDKIPVGICIYIDPKDPTRREMIGLDELSTGIQWGLFRDSSNGVNGFSSITLDDSPTYPVFDTPLPNITSSGISGNISDATLRDPNTDDGFKAFDTGVAVGDVGFMRLAVDFSYRGKTWYAGEYMPRSLYNTLVLMTHRNKVCQDSGVNIQIPAATSSMTEMESLISLMDAIVQRNGNQAKYRQYYYPAASMCHAYEPSIKSGLTLDEKFKAGNWALPALGTMARFSWYYMKAMAGEPEGAKLKEWIDQELFPKVGSNWFWASTEWIENNAWNINPASGQLFYNYNKFNSYRVLAVAAF